jgi:predicted aspartyl protease
VPETKVFLLLFLQKKKTLRSFLKKRPKRLLCLVVLRLTVSLQKKIVCSMPMGVGLRYLLMMAAMIALGPDPAAWAGECTLGRVAELPFRVMGGHLIVKGQINGNDATLVFDTGAATTFLTQTAPGHLNLRALRDETHAAGALRSASGIGGSVDATAVEATHVDLGGLKARNFAFLVIDRSFSFGGQPVDGLLSADLLAKYDIDLDFQSNRIRLFYPQGDCSHPAAYLRGNLFRVPMLPLSADRSPRIEVQVDGVTLTAMIDTGADGTLLTERAAQRLNLPPDTSGAARMIRGVGLAQVREKTVTLRSLAIGDLELQNWRAGVADVHFSTSDSLVDMIIGLDLLTRLHPWLSYSSNTFIFQYPPAPSPD